MRHQEQRTSTWRRAARVWAAAFGLLGACLATSGAQAATAWELIHQDRDSQLSSCTKYLGQRAEARKAAASKGPSAPEDYRLLGLSLDMDDAEVACRLITAYGQNTDVPLRIVDGYETQGDVIWRQQMRDFCAKRSSNVTGCVESTVAASHAGIVPSDMLALRDPRDNPNSVGVIGDWNRPDVTLIVFEWSPCTPFLVKRGFDRWRAKHLNIVTTGADPIKVDQVLPRQRGRTDELSGGRLPTLPYPTGAAMSEQAENAANNICLSGVQVRTTLRDRWANYAHIALRETAPEPNCADNCCDGGTCSGPRFKADYSAKESPESRVTDIVWKNSWLDRGQWLVMVRDHFLDRLRTKTLDPNYPLPSPARLVNWGPEVCYGGVPTGRHYYWTDGGKTPRNCDFQWTNLSPSKALESREYVELNISFNPNAELKLSHGPYFHDYWERAQARFVAREVERRARYWSAGPLVQNDDVANANANCPKPMPINANAKTRNAEAPRRDAVTPRFGDLMPAGKPPFPLGDPPPPPPGPPTKG